MGYIDLIYFIELLARLRKTIFLSHETIPMPDTKPTLTTLRSIIERMFQTAVEGDKVNMALVELITLQETFARSGEVEIAD